MKKNILASMLILAMLLLQMPGFSFVKAEGETAVETGDANVEVVVGNEVNTNSTEVSPSEQSSEGQNQESGNMELNNSNQNEAEIGNGVTAEAESGNNSVENEGSSIIDTGDSNVIVGIFNTANSNFVGSAFSQFLLNILSNLHGDVNLQDKINASSPESCFECLFISATNANNGFIQNNINIDGSSGSNTAISQTGDATINTGNVNVAANIFNVLNTNFIGSNWQSFIVNIFSDWTGDLVLPNKDKMSQIFDSWSNSSNCQNCTLSIDNSNQGEIQNEVSVNSDTGENVAIGDATITRTGESNVKVNTLNVANTNVSGGSWFFMVINTFGKWQGNVFSMPSELQISQNDAGIKIYNMDLENPESAQNGLMKVVNDNSGLIQNSIVINASTGSNEASAPNGTATVKTGNSNVLANLVNFLNTNVIGSNWLLGIVNIFGNWTGNIAFGKPDLWVGASAATPSNPARPGEAVTYTLTYKNNGDADATGVVLTDDFNDDYLKIIDSGNGIVNEATNKIEWNIGNIPVGSSGSVSYTVAISSEVPEGNTNLASLAAIKSTEKDWNSTDNLERLTVKVRREILWPYGPKDGAAGEIFKVTKSNKAEDGIAMAGSEVDYQIVVYNESLANLYDVVVEDVLVHKATSEVLNEGAWDLGQVLPYEQITIDYAVAFGDKIPPGIYTNTATVTGLDAAGNKVWSNVVSNDVNIGIQINYEPEATIIEESQEDEVALMKMKNQLDEIQSEIATMIEQATVTP